VYKLVGDYRETPLGFPYTLKIFNNLEGAPSEVVEMDCFAELRELRGGDASKRIQRRIAITSRRTQVRIAIASRRIEVRTVTASRSL